MPPPIEPSEDESSGGESIPFDESKKTEPVGAESEEEDEGEEGEDVYVVEKILGHEFDKRGTLYLQVKWKGYEKEEDQTMEPEDNLDGAQDAVNEYFSAIGGRPQAPEKASRKRKSTADSTSTPQSSKKARKSEEAAANGTSEGEGAPDWVPKSKNWENQIDFVETVMRDERSGMLYAFLHWKNGKKAKVSAQQCYQKCPLRMLQFYESHLVFKDEHE